MQNYEDEETGKTPEQESLLLLWAAHTKLSPVRVGLVSPLRRDVQELYQSESHRELCNANGEPCSCYTAPMTTHPHYELRRSRSKSLGSEIERRPVRLADKYQKTKNYGAIRIDGPSLGTITTASCGDSSLEPPDLSETNEDKGVIHEDGSSFGTLTNENGVYSPLETPDLLVVESDEKVDDKSPPKGSQSDDGNSVWICLMYGMINATIVLPVIMSFGSIIYRDEFFSPYQPALVKLTVVSGIVHQLCFSTFSSLPFAVGQVQDAGLIFLSAMATDVVVYCKEQGADDETILSTVTVGLALCTALLGFGLVVVGRLRLAQYVQMLPTSVVGGYLAFIGWFCGISGVGLMAGSTDRITPALVAEKFEYILPGVIGGIVIYSSVRWLQHMAVLPACIAFLLLSFYVVLWGTGTTLEEATDNGWIRKLDPPPVWYHTWDYLRLDRVMWLALPRLFLTELGMFFVVALSSSLDIVAIDIELNDNESLDYDRELRMVGISNIVSGLTGGYTGSYIFSQSIFSLRSGIRSPLAGYFLAMFQILVVVVPFPILSAVPNFFFGSLLAMICVDLVYEWLWEVRHKETNIEYLITLATFVLIQVLHVEFGILAGLALYLVCRKLGLNVEDLCENVVREDDDVDADAAVAQGGKFLTTCRDSNDNNRLGERTERIEKGGNEVAWQLGGAGLTTSNGNPRSTSRAVPY